MISHKMRLSTGSGVEGEKCKSPNSLATEKISNTHFLESRKKTHKILINHERQEVDKKRREKLVV